MKLATTISDFDAYTDSTFDKILHCADAGFRYLDYSFGSDFARGDGCFSTDWERYTKNVLRFAEERGLTFVQAHSPMGHPIIKNDRWEGFMAATKRCIECCQILGIPNIVIHSGYNYNLSREETFEQNKQFYEALLPTAERCGVNILTENFNKMCVDNLYWVDNAQDERDLIDYIGHPLLHACWDAGHGNMNDRSQDESLRILGSHVYALHVQDNLANDDHHFAPFFGTMNPDSLMHGLQEIGYHGYFTFEAGNLMLPAYKRKPYPQDTRLAQAPLFLKKQAEALLYNIGKYILETYDCFEG